MKERREWRRLDVSLPIWYKVQQRGGELLSIDISGGGVQLQLGEKLSKGTNIDLKIGIPGFPEPISVI